MKNLILTGEISSPDVISTIILLDKDLTLLSKDSFSLIKTNSFEYSYEIIKVVTDEIIDTLYFLRINDEIFKCSPVSYNVKNNFSFRQGILPFNVSDKSWIQKSPILFKKGTSELYSPIPLSYSESSTQQIILDNESVIEWFNYSSSVITSSEILNIGSGILFSFALKKKNSTPINCTFLSRTSYYLIEIMNDVFYINNNVTTLIVSEQFQLFSIWLGPNSTFKTWLNDSPKTFL